MYVCSDTVYVNLFMLRNVSDFLTGDFSAFLFPTVTGKFFPIFSYRQSRKKYFSVSDLSRERYFSEFFPFLTQQKRY